jgi:hypothetical protein
MGDLDLVVTLPWPEELSSCPVFSGGLKENNESLGKIQVDFSTHTHTQGL